MTARHRILLGLTILSLVSTSAAAAPLLWTLSGITFSDGGTASGSFEFDANTNTYSNINITTTTGSSRTGAVYHFRLSAAPSIGSIIVAVTASGGDLTGQPVLALQFTGAGLTNAGGTVASVGAESDCVDSGCSSGSLPQRNVTAGSVIGTALRVPTLSEWALGLLAFLLMGCGAMALRRRRVGEVRISK